MIPRLGLVDSGVSEEQAAYIHSSMGSGSPDRLGHGTAVCEIIRHHAPSVALYNAQVFDNSGVTTAAMVAAAIDWLVIQKVDMINLSLGLAQDRPVLREASSKAVSAGIILIASAPAQGRAVYPSSYDGMIRATGDARCGVGEISYLDSMQADFGGCPRGLDKSPTVVGGASMGTAHISGHVAAYLQGGGDRRKVREWLVSRAEYVHNERRTQ